MIKQSKFTGITDRRLKDFLHPKSYDDVEMKQLIHDMAGPDAKEVYLRQLTATLDRRDLTEEIKNLHCLVWYLAGADDKIISLSSIERSQQATPHSKLFTIKDCGHFIPLEQPDKVNQILLTLLTQVMHSSRMKI
jgi:pimeloyl-ACP methyl ester carboxylesterase